jgi:hypothetical protein
VSSESLDLNEDPDDVIETVSQPYLAGSVGECTALIGRISAKFSGV